jgi:hypothetical protein
MLKVEEIYEDSDKKYKYICTYARKKLVRTTIQIILLNRIKNKFILLIKVCERV